MISRFWGMLAREDATKRSYAKEPLAAGVATVRGKSQQLFCEKKRSFIHPLTGDPVQVKIPALRAVR